MSGFIELLSSCWSVRCGLHNPGVNSARLMWGFAPYLSVWAPQSSSNWPIHRVLEQMLLGDGQGHILHCSSCAQAGGQPLYQSISGSVPTRCLWVSGAQSLLKFSRAEIAEPF